MKRIITGITLIAAAALFVTPNTARAGDDTDALIGGLIGGMIIGAAIADDDVRTHVSVSFGHRRHYHDHGYWKWVTVKTWVPGYYERSCDRYGRPSKVWVSGHYVFEKQKVWVDRHHYGHHDYRGGRHHDRYGDDHRRHYRSHDRRDNDRHDRHDRYGRGDDRRREVSRRF